MDDHIEEVLRQIAARVNYPATPRVSAARPSRVPIGRVRLAAAVLAVILLSGVLVMIPPVRAALSEFLTLGGIGIFVGENELPPEATITRLEHLGGKTTLEEAVMAVAYTVRIPAGMGAPDEVYLQENEHQLLVFIWKNQGEVDLALYQFTGASGVYKGVDVVAYTAVNGLPAIWLNQPHYLWFDDGQTSERREIFLVEGNVLIWERGDVTFRLESGLSMEEAVMMAESLVEFGTSSP